MTKEETVLGLELGSTRIMAVTVGSDYISIFFGDYTCTNSYGNSI